MSNISALKQQAELLLAKLENGRFYSIADLNGRLQETVADYPQDTVIKAFACVVEEMCNKSPDRLISQGEIENMYNHLVGLNASGTKFREALGDLLLTGSGPVTPAVVPNSEFIGGRRDDVAPAMEYDMDPEVKRGFDNLFAPISDKYDPQCAVRAGEKVGLELRSIGCDASHVRLAGGNARFLVFAADFDTPRGAVRILIPAESSGEKLPSVFVAGDRFVLLTPANLRTHAGTLAECRTELPNVSAVLNQLDIMTGNSPKYVSDADMARTAAGLPGQNGSEGLSAPSVFASMPDESKNIRDIVIPPTPVPESLKTLAADIEESVLEAAVGYPQAAVRLAKRMVLVELTSMGFKGSQIRVAAPTSDGFICEAALNTPRGKVMIEVPIEMQNGVPLMPSVFAKGDYIGDFNAHNLQAFAMQEGPSDRASVRRDSPLLEMNIGQLRDIVCRAAIQGDFATCDEVLEAVAQSFDEDTYRNAVADYHKLLTNLTSTKETIAEAYDSNQFVRTPNSMYPIHKKLGRPIHELIRDENGEYHLKATYQARQNQDVEGAFFSNARVLYGEDEEK